MSTGEAYLEYKIRKCAAVVATIQSLTWMILSIICISFYIRGKYYANNIIPDEVSYMEFINTLMYIVFLERDRPGLPFTQSLTPPVFLAFMIVYLVIDIFWFYVSIRVLKTQAADRYYASRVKNWSYITFSICCIDFITVIILGSDYYQCSSSIVEDVICANTTLIALVIAAKGFVLWFVNIIFAGVLYNMARALEKIQTHPTMMYQPNAGSYPSQGYSNTVGYLANQQHYPDNTISVSGMSANSLNDLSTFPNRFRGATPYRPFQQQMPRN